MGNRAFIRFVGENVGIYLHWNGGRDSVEGFLDYCKLRGFRFDDYGVARMTQVIGNFFGGDLSIGVQSVNGFTDSHLDPGDNGVYIVNDWEIIDRYPGDRPEQHEYNKLDFMIDVDNAQPENDRVGRIKIEEYVASKTNIEMED